MTLKKLLVRHVLTLDTFTSFFILLLLLIVIEINRAENLRKLGLKDNNIQVLKGFFNESLQTLDQDSLLALVHLDSDSYEAIKESLEALYPKVSKGGYVIVDDMHLPGVQRAVAEFLLSVKGSVSPLWPVGGDYVHSCGIQNDIPSYVELKSEKTSTTSPGLQPPNVNVRYNNIWHLVLHRMLGIFKNCKTYCICV